MKIKRIKLKNVKSFKEETEIEFNDDFNILIGPSGSGKSNLLDILTICLFLPLFLLKIEGLISYSGHLSISRLLPLRTLGSISLLHYQVDL